MHTVKVDEETLYCEFREIRFYQLRRALQFLLMMVGFPLAVSIKSRQATVGGAIGVAHKKHTRSAMQPNGHPHLLQNEIAFEIIARRSQCFRPASNHNHVRPQNTLPP